MMPNKVKAKTESIKLTNRSNIRTDYKTQNVEETTDYNDYSEEKSGFNFGNLIEMFVPSQEDVNGKLVEKDYVLNIFGYKIDLEKELDSAIANLPFKVELYGEDRIEFLNIMKNNISKFIFLRNKNIKLDDILELIEFLNEETDISYERMSKIVPDIDNVIKFYLNPYVGDVVTIDYNNIGKLWDAFLSNNSSKLNSAIDKCLPNFNEELSEYIKKNTNWTINPEEIDAKEAISRFALDIPGNLEKVDNIKNLIESDNILDKLNGATEAVFFLGSLGITVGDMAHIIHDTGADIISSNVTSIVRDIPYIGEGLIDFAQTVSDGYDFIAENSKSIPLVGDGIHYLMTTDIVDKAEDAWEFGSGVASDVYNLGCDFVDFITFWD